MARGRLAGIGVANAIEAPVGAPHERVVASVRGDGWVEITVGTQSTGQGHATGCAQVVADQLDVPPGCARLITGDTDLVSAGGGTHSDRSMRLAGTLLVEVCARIVAQACSLAAELLGVPGADLVFTSGMLHPLGAPGRCLSLFQLAERGHLSAEAAFTGRLPAHPTGAAVGEVEIDPEMGVLEISRYTCVDDVANIYQGGPTPVASHLQFLQATGADLTQYLAGDAVRDYPNLTNFPTYNWQGTRPSWPWPRLGARTRRSTCTRRRLPI